MPYTYSSSCRFFLLHVGLSRVTPLFNSPMTKTTPNRFFLKLWSQHEILETWFVVSCLTPSTALNLLPQKYSFFLILKTFAGTFDLVKPFSGNFWRTGLLSSVMVTCPSQSRWLGFSLLISRGVPQSFSKGGGHHLCCKLATEVMSGLPVAKREQEQPLPSSKTHDWLV